MGLLLWQVGLIANVKLHFVCFSAAKSSAVYGPKGHHSQWKGWEQAWKVRYKPHLECTLTKFQRYYKASLRDLAPLEILSKHYHTQCVILVERLVRTEPLKRLYRFPTMQWFTCQSVVTSMPRQNRPWTSIVTKWCSWTTMDFHDVKMQCFIRYNLCLCLSEMLWCKSWQIMIFHETEGFSHRQDGQ